MKKILLAAALILTIGFSNAHIENGVSWQQQVSEEKATHRVHDASVEFRPFSTISHFVSPGLMHSLQ